MNDFISEAWTPADYWERKSVKSTDVFTESSSKTVPVYKHSTSKTEAGGINNVGNNDNLKSDSLQDTSCNRQDKVSTPDGFSNSEVRVDSMYQ